MFRTAATLLLSGCLLLLMAAKPSQAAEPGEGAWMYGVSLSPTVRIQQFNPLLAIAEEVFETGLDKFANALAFDPARDQLFFMIGNFDGPNVEPELGLYFFGVATMQFVKIASLADIGVNVNGDIAYNAAYYDSECLRERRRRDGNSVWVNPNNTLSPSPSKTIDAYWFVPQNTATLRKVTFTYADGVPTGVSGTMDYPFANQAAPYPYDIAINVST